MVLAAPGCKTKPAPLELEGGALNRRPPRFLDGGPAPDASVSCGGAVCPEPAGGDVLGEIPCCLPSGECGLRVPLLGNRCSLPSQPGGVDTACPSVTMPNGAVTQGCCGPLGRCGAYDRFGPLGCIVVDTSDAGMRCEYDPEKLCRSVVAVPCDGPEDCGAGNVCCARNDFGLYDLYGCFKSCEIAENTDRGVWLELCHSPDDCRDSTDVCTSQPGLVSSASACYPSGSVRKPDASVREGGTADASSTGTTRDATVAEARESGTRDSSTSNEEGVTCGALHCPAGRMCCVLEPGTSYCAPYADGCSCSGPRASHADADVEASAGGAGAGDRDATDTDTD